MNMDKILEYIRHDMDMIESFGRKKSQHLQAVLQITQFQ